MHVVSRITDEEKDRFGSLRFLLFLFSRHIEWISLYNDFTTHRYETLRVRAAMYTYDTSILSQQYGKT